jgi:glutamate dehydrogenase (NAD(P)+)/glutamate dehydrogenase (NADP+)
VTGQLDARQIAERKEVEMTQARDVMHQGAECIGQNETLADAGGVICAATELRGGNRTQAFAAIKHKIHDNTIELVN